MDKETKLSLEEFQQDVRPRLYGFAEKVVALAELFFVDRKSIKDAGEQLGMSKQSASQNIKRVLAELNNVPKDWIYYEGYMPPDLAKETRQKVDDLLPKNNKKTPLT